jgi:VWFA-related protein
MAQKSDVVIYAVSTNSERTETRGDKILKYITQQTGGSAYFPLKADDLIKSFHQLADELRHQYNIYYRPEAARADGRYHAVTVSVKGRKDLVVRSRRGYYAPIAAGQASR